MPINVAMVTIVTKELVSEHNNKKKTKRMTTVGFCRDAMDQLQVSDECLGEIFRACADRNALVQRAVGANNERAVRLLIATNVNLNFKVDSKGQTLLHHACKYASRSIVAMLLAAGADAAATDDERTPPWHLAAYNPDETLMSVWIERGIDINAANAQGIGLLHVATTIGNSQLLEKLIDAGGNLNASDGNGYTPLHCATLHGFSGCVSLLLDAGARAQAQDPAGARALHYAKDPDCAALLISAKRANVNAVDKRGWTACHYASDRPLVLSKLISAGAKVSVQGKRHETALHIAASKAGNTEAMSMLIAAGADVHQSGPAGRSAGHCAANAGHVDNLKLLLAQGARINRLSNIGETMLYVAAAAKHAEVVNALIAAGADPNITTNARVSPLDVSLLSCPEIAARLLQAGASVRGIGPGGRTTCQVAARSPTHAMESLRLVIAAGADVRAIDDIGASVAHGANATVIPLLRSLGLDLNAADDHGCTPCHAACNSEALMTLFALGVNMSIVNKAGHTPYQMFLTTGRVARDDALLTFIAAGLGFGVQTTLSTPEISAIAIAGGGYPWRQNVNQAELLAHEDIASERIMARQKQLIRLRAFQVCVGLQDFHLPALITYKILKGMFAPLKSSVPRHFVMQIVEKVKHFKK